MEWHSNALDPMISEAYCGAVDVTIYTDANCISMGHWAFTDISGFRRYGSMLHMPISPTQFRRHRHLSLRRIQAWAMA